jgi:uncharacterized repeat protein (TIGR03943 family)
MKKRFLGIVCLLYAGIIIYVVLSNNLKNYLAPQMQMYLKVSVVPLIIIGLVLCLNNKINYKFKISDLILLLPIIILIFAGNGRLTSNFASNRTTSFKNKTKLVTPTPTTEPTKEPDQPKDDKFIPDYEIVDENYNELANYITYPPKTDKLINKKIKVRGLSLKSISYIPSKYTMIGKYSISCCAADAEFIGFILDYDKSKIENNTWYEVEGTLKEKTDDNGYTIMVIDVENIKELEESKQEQYIYPCSNYGNGKCSEVLKYDLEY